MKIKIKRRSISRNIIFVLGNSPRYHGNQLYLNEKKKKKKKKIALSTTEVEYLSLIECTKQALWIKKLENGLINRKKIRINIRKDNKPCKEITENKKKKKDDVNI